MASGIGNFSKAEAKSLLDDLHNFINEDVDDYGLSSAVDTGTVKTLNKYLSSLYGALSLDNPHSYDDENDTETPFRPLTDHEIVRLERELYRATRVVYFEDEKANPSEAQEKAKEDILRISLILLAVR